MNLFKGKFNKPEQVEFALSVLATRDLDFVERVFAHGAPWDKDDNEPMEALDVIANCVRSMIVAAPGHRLITADYNAIQAVITAALAGEKWQLDVFHNGGQIYLETASQLTGVPVAYYVQYRKETGKHHPDRQLYGKIPTLANGFGAYIGGWRRFDDDGILGTDAEVKELIFKTWAKNPNICELWGGQTRNKFGRDRLGRRANEYQECYGLEGAAVKAVLNPGVCFPYRGIQYQVHNDVLYCMPPGGGAPLVYHEPRLERSSREHARPWELELTYVGWNSNTTKGKGGWTRMDFYGGVATQNIVAKVHREFQADTLVALEKTGVYRPVHHAHDENVTEVADGQAMLDACAAAGSILMIAYPVRFAPSYLRLRAMVEAGRLGDVFAVLGTNNGKIPYDARQWFTDKDLAGGGALVDHTVHCADLIDGLTGGASASRVYAAANHVLHQDKGVQVETGGLVTITYDNGLLATIDCSWSVPDNGPTWGGVSLQVTGTNGSVEIEPFLPHVGGTDAEGEVFLAYGGNLDASLLDTFLKAVRESGPPVPGKQPAVVPQPDGAVGLRTLQIVDAARRSAVSGQPIDL